MGWASRKNAELREVGAKAHESWVTTLAREYRRTAAVDPVGALAVYRKLVKAVREEVARAEGRGR